MYFEVAGSVVPWYIYVVLTIYTFVELEPSPASHADRKSVV